MTPHHHRKKAPPKDWGGEGSGQGGEGSGQGGEGSGHGGEGSARGSEHQGSGGEAASLSNGHTVTATKAATFVLLIKSQLSAFVATAVDNTLYAVLNEVFGVHYAGATALGAASGAVTNFAVNRKWVFGAGESGVVRQVVRYALVSAGSLLLNTALVFVLTEYLGLYKHLSKAIAAIGVAVLYNFPAHRYYVFR